MLRKLALSLAVAGAIASTQANALGLGDIRIKSALNEPLNAEIKLSQIRDLSPLQIRPRMADQDEFALAGISQQRALSDVRFQVKVNPNGTGVILMTSVEPIKEPFMNFLVEVNWPSGRLVREYTVLLDPPVFDPTPTQQFVEPARSSAVQNRPVILPESVTSSRTTPPKRKARTKPTEAYVDVKDTLWELAIRHRAAPDISSYQMMVAMYKMNPQAFPDGNINNLKAGVVVKLPTEAQARAMSSKDAAAEVRRQTQLWKQGKSVAPKAAPIDGTSSKVKSEAADSEAAESEDNGQLKVVTPSDTGSQDDAAINNQSEGDQSTAELIKKNEELENKLAVSQESLDRLERDNDDLDQKLDAIQEQLQSLQKLIELKDQQLAALQTQLDQAKQPVAPPPAAPEKSLIDKIMQTPEYLAGIGGGLIALLVGLWLMLRRKKKDEDAFDDDELLTAPTLDLDESTESTLDELDDAADELAEAAAEEAIEETASDLPDDMSADLDDLESLDDLENLDDLDLDMDLDMDDKLDAELEALGMDDMADDDSAEENVLDADEEDLLGSILEEQQEAEQDANIEDDEFDLGLDDLDSLDDLDMADNADDQSDLSDGLDAVLEETAHEDAGEEISATDDLELDSSLDDLLEETDDLSDADDDEPDALLEDLLDSEPDEVEIAQQQQMRSGMGSVEPMDEIEDTAETLESLGLDQLAEEKPESTEDESDDLDFDLDAISEELSETDDDAGSEDLAALESELEELDFELGDLDAALEDDLAEVDSSTDELADLDVSELEEASEESVVDAPDEDAFDLDADLTADLDEVLADETADMELADMDMAEVGDLDEILGDDLSPEALDAEALDEPALDVEEVPGDLDLAGMELDEVELPTTPSDEEVTQELTSNIEHDLDAELDDELEALLSSTDNDIALEETSSDEENPLDALGLLDGADEVETKLDLARAYIDMDDLDGARDILNEIAQEGNDNQQQEAKSLLEGLS